MELRIALIIIGIAVLIALYFFGKIKRDAIKGNDEDYDFSSGDLPDPLEQNLSEPSLADIDKSPTIEVDLEAEQELGDLSNLVREDLEDGPRRRYSRTERSIFKHQPSLLDEEEAEEEPEKEVKLVVLHVAAKRPQKFAGQDLVNLTKELGLDYDDLNIFHKNVERFSGKKALYSIVNMVKPGTFDLQTIQEFETPGISFVMNLPGPEEGLKAFNIMLEAARKFADDLNGDLLDESRSRLSPQTIAHLQEDIQLFSLKNSRHSKN